MTVGPQSGREAPGRVAHEDQGEASDLTADEVECLRDVFVVDGQVRGIANGLARAQGPTVLA